MRKLTFGSLFTGVGGFDLGFERAGMECRWQVEIDKHCQSVLEKHWPDTERFTDVRKVGRHNLEPVGLVCGGFPCQDLSVAGKREGLAGERSGLWYEFHRVLSEVRPKWVVIENVPGLLFNYFGPKPPSDLQEGQEWETEEESSFGVVVQGLVECGYSVAWRVFDSQYFGVAQRRRRVFIIGHLGDGRAAEVLFEPYSSEWDTPPSRCERKRSARDIEGNIGGSGDREHIASAFSESGPGWWREGLGTLRAEGENRPSRPSNLVTFSLQTSNTKANASKKWWKEHTYPLQTGDVPAVAYELFGGSKRKDRPSGGFYVRETETAKPLDTSGLTPNCAQGGVLVCGVRENVRSEVGLMPYVQINSGGGKPGQGYPAVMQVQWASGGGKMENDTAQSLRAKAEHNYQFLRVGACVRRLTPLECERLQGFPDNWTEGQSDTQRYKQMGNAVTVSVIEWIGKRILGVVPESG